MVQKTLTTKEKIDILDFSKIKDFCLERHLYDLEKEHTEKKIYIYKK